MMGFQTDNQERLFYSFNLEDHVPQNHLLRGINQYLDLNELHQHLAEHYSHTGRPSIDPELMIRMLIIGYSFGIRSERRLCEEVHLNLAYRWFCRLGLEDKVPDHSTFSKNRHGRFRDSGIFRHLFETVLQRCMNEGLVRGEGFATDDCAACPQKERCCPNTEFRKITRSVHEDARDVARKIYLTPEYQESRRERKKIEMLFAHLKRILKVDRLRLRGFSGAQDEFLLAATAQNLRRMAKWLMPVTQEDALIPA
jgi:transposase